MLLIFVSWIYILFTCINLGFGFGKFMKLHQRDFVNTAFLGLFSTSILASSWAIFGRINIEFHIFLLLFNIGLTFHYRTGLIKLYTNFIAELKNLSFGLSVFLVLISAVIIAQCASAPYVIDNESYYIQTIKWLNEYGFVKGLANLHIFFGQTSGWHIVQSAFSFSFLYRNFNDLSGLCLLLGNIFAVLKLNAYFSNQKPIDLIIGLFPLANVFFLQFVSAPSPDIPVYVLTFIAFYYCVERFKDMDTAHFNLIAVFVLFIVFVKAIAIGLLLIPLLLLVFNFKTLYPKLLRITIVGSIALVLFVVKNSIISGFPLFPTTYLRLDYLDYAVPEQVAQYYFNENKLYSFFITRGEFESMGFAQIAMKWFLAAKINGALNCLTILIFLVMPFFIKRYFNEKVYWMLYGVAFCELTILLLTSPVYRFFIHLTFFFCCMIFAAWFARKHWIVGALTLTTMASVVVLLIPINFSMLTKNKLIIHNSQFSYRTFVFPHGNSKSDTQFLKHKKGNLTYNTPLDNSFFWGTGNGDLPCVNKDQLLFFEKYLLVYPQQRTVNMEDGFYAKRLTYE